MAILISRLVTIAFAFWFSLVFYLFTSPFNGLNGNSCEGNAPNFISTPESGQSNLGKLNSQINIKEQTNCVNDALHRRLTLSLIETQTLRKENEELKALKALLLAQETRQLDQKPKLVTSAVDSHNETASSKKPVITNLALALHHDYQHTRRSIENGLVELWYSATTKLKNLKDHFNEHSQESESIHLLTNELTDQYRTVLADTLKLSSVGGDDEKRRRILWSMTQTVQNRIRYLQNPPNCSEARKLVCSVSLECGFGCQLHHVTYCLIVAYGTRRTMVIGSSNHQYSDHGWNGILKPPSNTCQENMNDQEKHRAGRYAHVEEEKANTVYANVISSKMPYLPLNFPEEFAERLTSLHGYPPAWWIGQFVWYLIQYEPDFQQEINSRTEKLKFANPCVAIHVRRTDKIGTEAEFHALEEYMVFVEAWYRVEAIRKGTTFDVITKRVYLATDEPNVFAEAVQTYPQYIFIGDPEVCRAAYEVMQVLRGDAASRFHSLDDLHYFNGQNPRLFTVIHPHKAMSQLEIDLEVGDVIEIAKNHHNGSSTGTNKRSGKTGLYPSYKAEDKWRIVSFPNYTEVDMNHFAN